MKLLKTILPFALFMSFAASSELHKAARLGDEKMLRALLETGSDVNAKDEYNVGQLQTSNTFGTPLMTSIYHNQKESFDVILNQEAVKVNAVNEHGQTALYYAALQGNEAMCSNLFEKGADVNAQDDEGATPLMQSIYSNKQECFDVILKREDVEVNAVDKYGQTALHHAAAQGNEVMCSDLLEKGANVNAKSNSGKTPLIESIDFNKKESFDVILKREDVQLNAAGEYGDTALHYAAAQGKEAMCRALLKRGADVNAEDNTGETPYDCATNDDCAEMILIAMKKQYFFKIRSYVAGKEDRKPVIFNQIKI